MWSTGLKLLAASALLAVTGCAGAPAEDTSGIRIVRRTPDEFCRGTARNVAVDRYNMKREGASLKEALDQNGGVDVIDAITKAIYSRNPASESQAADAGTAACLAYFR